jgi:hypothetical protein
VYLTNVETLARKFVEEKREALVHLRDDSSGFRMFWASLDPKKRKELATASGETILKVNSQALQACHMRSHVMNVLVRVLLHSCFSGVLVPVAVRQHGHRTSLRDAHVLLGSRGGEGLHVALQGIVKRFFNEKEVTSTLVMDALFSGAKQLEETSRQMDAKKVASLASTAPPAAS